MDALKLLENILKEFAANDVVTLEKFDGGVTVNFKEPSSETKKTRKSKAKVSRVFTEAKVDVESIPAELRDYFEVLKTAGLHLHFFDNLTLISQVWPDYESFRTFLGERKTWYESKKPIGENFHAYRAFLIKSVKEMIGV